MGLLVDGTGLTWEEIKKISPQLKKLGVKQFINAYQKLGVNSQRSDLSLKWGDEIEGILLKFDHQNKKVKLMLKNLKIIDDINAYKELHPKESGSGTGGIWMEEFGAYMIEATPAKPYGNLLADLTTVQHNMHERRNEIKKVLDEDSEVFLTIVNFPRLSCDYRKQPKTMNTPMCSVLPSELLCTHPRFTTLTKNINSRRGRRFQTQIPVYQDTHTRIKHVTETSRPVNGISFKPPSNDLLNSAVVCGYGHCCLQVTLQASNVDQARTLYDQFIPLTPIMLALSVASPTYCGYVKDIDSRWDVISRLVDDRTTREKDTNAGKSSKRAVISKSRYGTVSCYLTEDAEKYNDIPLACHEQMKQLLLDGGVDAALANHISHLFIRDPLVIYDTHVEPESENDMYLFESIQSTNWNSMRFKSPPSIDSDIGWRVEFRPMEIQLTDFENAAYAVFIILLSRVILHYKLDLLMPISKVDENMTECQKVDAVTNSSFFFKQDILNRKESETTRASRDLNHNQLSDDHSIQIMSIDTIINGKEHVFPGFIPLIHNYLDDLENVDIETRCTIDQYLSLISKRASGELLTTAGWIRRYITSHHDYRHDSVISDLINYDLLYHCYKIGEGLEHESSLCFTPDNTLRPIVPDDIQNTGARI